MFSVIVMATVVLLATVAIHGGAVMLLLRIGRKRLVMAQKLTPAAAIQCNCEPAAGRCIRCCRQRAALDNDE